MDRRSFLKIGGSIVAAGITGSCGQMAQKIIPFVTPLDEGINPVDGTWYYTSCRMCEAGCGIMVRTVLGRAKKVEGNPNHPISRGGVCARGHAAVRQLYHPERIKAPLLRSGAKGSGGFKAISWDEALSILAANMKKARESAYVISSSGSDITAAVAMKVLKRLGSNDFAVPDAHGLIAYQESLSGRLFPLYDLTGAGCVLLLGADIFEEGASPVHYGWAYGKMRRGNETRRGKMIYAGSRISMTASSADRFVAVKNGMLGVFALGIAHEALELAGREGIPLAVSPSVMGDWKAALSEFTPEKAGQAAGISAQAIKEIAMDLLKLKPAVAVPGDGLFLHSNGVAALEAAGTLNQVLRVINGGVSLLHEMSEPDLKLRVRMKEFIGVPENAADYSALKNILGKAAAGSMKLGIVINADPVHHLPQALNASEALSKMGFVAQFSNFLNDTSLHADLVLPDRHFLESWSLQVVDVVAGVPVLNAQQPVVAPLYENSMQAGDVLAKAADIAGLDTGVKSQEVLIAAMVEFFRPDMKGLPIAYSGKEAWESLLQRGGWWREGQKEEPVRTAVKGEFGRPSLPLPVFSGGAEYPFHLHPYHTVSIGTGNMANIDWLLEMPDPMTSVKWGSWVEINPATADKLGIADGEIVRVESRFGSIEVPACRFPGIAPDTLAVPYGYGHSTFGKNAAGRGSNAMRLIGDFPVVGKAVPAARGIMVRLAKTGRKVELIREGNPKGDYEGEVFQL